MARFWLGVASLDHVTKGVEGGFAQLCHGSAAELRRMGAGDWIIYYSPRERMKDGLPVQSFTALGQVLDRPVYAVDMGDGFIPNRRDVDFHAVRRVPIGPLLTQLDFTRAALPNWGQPLRRGVVELSEGDFRRISTAMVGKSFDCHRGPREVPASVKG